MTYKLKNRDLTPNKLSHICAASYHKNLKNLKIEDKKPTLQLPGKRYVFN